MQKYYDFNLDIQKDADVNNELMYTTRPSMNGGMCPNDCMYCYHQKYAVYNNLKNQLKVFTIP